MVQSGCEDSDAPTSSSPVACQYITVGGRNLSQGIVKVVSSAALLPTFSAHCLPSGMKRQRTVEHLNQRFASSTKDALR